MTKRTLNFWKGLRTAGCALLMAPVLAIAQAPVAPGPEQADLAPGHGAQTRAWLDLQKSGKAAPQTPEGPQPGEVADRVYQRYLDSYTSKIPDTYPRDSFSSGGQGK